MYIYIHIYTYIVHAYLRELRILRKPSFTMVSPPLKWGGILGEIYGEGLLYMGELNDQIMPKEGELYKRIFQ